VALKMNKLRPVLDKNININDFNYDKSDLEKI